jgi:hypothetical protein
VEKKNNNTSAKRGKARKTMSTRQGTDPSVSSTS